jgi:putative DNA primase/helicase
MSAVAFATHPVALRLHEPAVGNSLSSFRRALVNRHIVPPETLNADGLLHRCDAAGRHGRHDAAYVLHLDGTPAGGFINWQDGKGWEPWRLDQTSPLDPAQRSQWLARVQAGRERALAETAQRHEAARLVAERIWNSAHSDPDNHPYLVAKGVLAYGVRQHLGVLVVPVRSDDGVLQSLQFISATGAKRFLKGGQVQGMFGWVGGPAQDVVCVAEGFATAASIHAATGWPVAIAFHAGNLQAVAGTLRRQHPEARLVICADDDHATVGNPGLTLARLAAAAVGAGLAVPLFGEATSDRPADATDFNDMQRVAGLNAVRDTVAAAVSASALVSSNSAAGAVMRDPSNDWPEPEPLHEDLPALPYPVDALPSLLREAVAEVQAFVQAPMALVACSALSALSLAAQGLANVRRDRQLVGPVSLYLLAVADSGERKSTCDRLFGTALREWERDRMAAITPDVGVHEAAVASYEARKAGVLDAIKQRRKRGQDTADEESSLEKLVLEPPVAPCLPRLLYADATPEALAHSLATGWPSAGVLSAEAGAVVGAHGMGPEVILRNLALLNVLWDGGEIAIDRRSKPSFLLRDRRLTMGLMLQPEALRGFLERGGTLPRGSGFIARFLISWPVSTQGGRAYRPAPVCMPALDHFNTRIRTLLATPLVKGSGGGLNPLVLDLSATAMSKWVQAHDRIEHQLGANGAYQGIRDVAAKAAENIARLAALFHILTYGPAGTINADVVERADHLIGWHLDEARRLLTDLDTPPSMISAIRLDEWLLAEAVRTGSFRIPTQRVYQYGPSATRDAKSLRLALATLTERGGARMEEEGKRRFVVVNPVLVGSRVGGVRRS